MSMFQLLVFNNCDSIIHSLHVVTFIFSGSVETAPFLLYHDEISLGATFTSGNLTCMVESSTPVWRNVGAFQLDTSSPLQSTTSGLMSRLSRTGAPIPNDTKHNGMWSCIQEDRNAFGYIGIYNRGEGKLTYTSSR